MGNFKEDIARIRAFVFDVDGVMTDGGITVTPEGEFLRTFYAKDGYALSLALKKGYRIAIITGPEASRPGRERLRGYYRALREHGLPVTPAYIRKGDFMVDCAYEQTLALCAMQEPPTAVFSSNNMTTYGCLKAFNELGLRVGADIALVGFDDIDALCWLDYNISVVSRDVPEMGKQAMRLLLQRFESERGERAGARECLPTELLLRGSELLPESGRAH